MEIEIRAFDKKDKEECMNAFKSNVPSFFAEAEIKLYENFLSNMGSQTINGKYFQKTYYYVILSDGKIVGAGGFGYNDKTHYVSLAWGLVHKDFQKKGFGEKLLVYRLEKIRELHPTSFVIIDTTQFTYTFFEKFGFMTLKITPDHYAAGMHRYDMILKA